MFQEMERLDFNIKKIQGTAALPQKNFLYFRKQKP